MGCGSGGGKQQLSPDLRYVTQTYGPHFRPAVNILLVGFGGGVVLVVLVVLVLVVLVLLVLVVLVLGVKQSQHLDF